MRPAMEDQRLASTTPLLAICTALCAVLGTARGGTTLQTAEERTTFVPGFVGEPEGGFRDLWHTHLGFVTIGGVRQKPPHLEIRWKSAPVQASVGTDKVTFAWTGALGAGEGAGGNFTILVNGREAADLDVVIRPTRFIPLAVGCELLYDAVWVYGNSLDSSGHFFLTVPADWVRPREAATLEVKARDVGAHRWFGLLAAGDEPLSVPERWWRDFVRGGSSVRPPPPGEEASYPWYFPQYRDPGILTTIGPPGDPAETAVSPTGQLIDSNEVCHGRGGIAGRSPGYVRNALAFAFHDGEEVVPAGGRGPVRQELLEGFLPIVETSWGHGGVEVRQTSFAEPLEGSDYTSGTERTLAWAGIDLTNTAPDERPLTFLAFHTGDEKDPRPPMTHRGGAVLRGESALFSAQVPAGFGVEFLPVFPPDAKIGGPDEALRLLSQHRVVFNALVVRGALPARGTARLVFNRVFEFPGALHWPAPSLPPVPPRALTEKSFTRGLDRMRSRWEGLARGISCFDLPEAILNDLYRKTMLDGYFLTKRWNGRSIVFDSVSYRCQWDDASTKWFYALDLLGDHETARRLLDTVFARQGQRKPAGTRTREGCFSDVTNTTGAGSAASWASCNGWALWAMAQHARLTNGRKWLDDHKSAILEGCEWILRERTLSKEDPDSPCAGLIHGKFVCDLPDSGEVSGVGFFTYTDAISHLGLSDMARLLEEWGHPEGRHLITEAEGYRKDIVATVDRLTDRSRYPWYVPWMLHAPRYESRYFYDACGPINLALGGVVPRDDERIAHVIRWIIDRTHGGCLESTTAGVNGPTEGAMFYSQDLAVTRLELGSVEEFLRIFYTLLASNVSHETLTTCEWMGNTQPHVHSIASLVRMLRTMLLQERDGALYLLQGTPRKWLEDGKAIRIREAPTWYGPLSLEVVSRVGSGAVEATLRMPERLGKTPVKLKLRLPPGLEVDAALAGDRPVPVSGEWLLLTPELFADREVRLRAQVAPERRRSAGGEAEGGAVNLRFPPDPRPTDLPQLRPVLVDDLGQPVATEREWEARREKIRKRWLEFIGDLQVERAPLKAEVVNTEELPSFTRRHVRYQVEDGDFTDGYLLVPRSYVLDSGGKSAAVVVFHQTVESQAKQPAGVDLSRPELMIGVQLAERGYIVLCPRCFIFRDGADYAGNVGKMKERHPAWLGMTKMAFEGIRAADYLESLPFVDSNRIGCIGHSLGAKEVLYAAALDGRFKAAVFSEGGIGLRFSNWEAIWYLGPRIRENGFPLEHHELISLIAPRAFLLLAGDSADGSRSWAFVEAALPVYRLLEAKESIGWLRHGAGHRYPPEARRIAEAFLDRHLGR